MLYRIRNNRKIKFKFTNNHFILFYIAHVLYYVVTFFFYQFLVLIKKIVKIFISKILRMSSFTRWKRMSIWMKVFIRLSNVFFTTFRNFLLSLDKNILFLLSRQLLMSAWKSSSKFCYICVSFSVICTRTSW